MTVVFSLAGVLIFFETVHSIEDPMNQETKKYQRLGRLSFRVETYLGYTLCYTGCSVVRDSKTGWEMLGAIIVRYKM
jgi:hypothetical protein